MSDIPPEVSAILSLDRWLALAEKLDVSLTDESFAELMARYAEPQRFYHTAIHIADCLRLFDSAPIASSVDGPAAEFALWMHDVVYDPKAVDNEQRSADLARAWLLASGSNTELADTVSGLIMATAHGSNDSNSAEPLVDRDQGENSAADWVVDIDLSILGCSPERFVEFGEQIRKEYSHIGDADYLAGRLTVLKMFQKEPSLYRTSWFYDRFEEPARKNLELEIANFEEATMVVV